jgi:hypothetical protein
MKSRIKVTGLGRHRRAESQRNPTLHSSENCYGRILMKIGHGNIEKEDWINACPGTDMADVCVECVMNPTALNGMNARPATT